ncbi:MAG: TonB-dependent receptor [Flavobacteriales bacterium]|nr:TonB-dependent receptor [Flavobacteriales bacterium]
MHGQCIKGIILLDGKPASYSTILIDKQLNTIADENGYFSFITDTGSISLKIRYTGAIPKDTIIHYTNTTCQIEINLQPDIRQLHEVVISDGWKEVERSSSPINIEIYRPDFLHKNGSQQLFESIQLINGVRPQINCNVCQAGDIHINGMEGPYTMVTMDGMPLVSGLGTVYGLMGIPLSLIERIEVIKGPASTLFGSEAMAGVINIITKNPRTAPRFSFQASSSTWLENTADLSGKFTLGKHKFMGNISGQFQPLAIDHNHDGFIDQVKLFQVSSWVKYQLERKQHRTFQTMIRYIHEDRLGGQMHYTHALRGSDSIYGESIYTRRGEWLMHYQLPIQEKIHFQSSYNIHYQDSWYGNSPYKAVQQILFHQLYWQKTIGKHELLAGIAGRWNYYDDNTTATADEDSLQIMNNPHRVYMPGIYFQHLWNIHAAHTLQYGMRLEYHPEHGVIYSPRLNYKVTLKNNHHLRLNFGKGFRVVNLFTEEHAALSGSRQVVLQEKLRPEESLNATLHYEGVLSWKKGFFRVDAGIFYTYFFNQIIPDYDSDPDLIIYRNLDGYGHSRGANLQAEFQLDLGLTLRTGITLADASVFNNINNSSRQLIHAPLWSGNWVISYYIPKTSMWLDFSGIWNGPMRLPIQPNDFRPEYSPWFSIANIQLNYSFKNGIYIYAGAKNLFNFIPKHPILRPHDPFDQWVNDPINNPQGYTFDTSYNYAPLQGVRAFAGIRYVFK